MLAQKKCCLLLHRACVYHVKLNQENNAVGRGDGMKKFN